MYNNKLAVERAAANPTTKQAGKNIRMIHTTAATHNKRRDQTDKTTQNERRGQLVVVIVIVHTNYTLLLLCNSSSIKATHRLSKTCLAVTYLLLPYSSNKDSDCCDSKERQLLLFLDPNPPENAVTNKSLESSSEGIIFDPGPWTASMAFLVLLDILVYSSIAVDIATQQSGKAILLLQ